MRFRERHQDPNSTDMEYSARINGYKSIDDFIAAHSGAPWFVSMVGFVAGLPWLYSDRRAVEADRSAEISCGRAPIRRSSPSAMAAASWRSIRCAAPAAIRCSGLLLRRSTTRQQKLPYFKDFLAFFRPGDIVKWKPISREEYDRDVKAVEAGTFDLTFRPVNFSLKAFHADPGGYSRRLVEVLHGH